MSYAIVRKRVAGSPLMYHPYAKRARTAYSIGAYAYRNRAKIRWAAKKIGRAYRRSRAKKRFSPRNFGEPVGTGGAKRFETDDSEIVSRDTRTQYIHSLLDIPQGTAINQRERNVINMRGIKLCMEIKSLCNEPLYINVAVLAPKDGVTAVSTNDFFRASGATERARDFSITCNSNEFHCLPINTDRYTILKHKRLRIIPQGAGTTTTVSLNGFSYANLNWWIPIKRQIRFNADTGSPVSGEVSLVYWADKFHTAAGTAISTDQFSVMRRAVAYYREPKN